MSVQNDRNAVLLDAARRGGLPIGAVWNRGAQRAGKTPILSRNYWQEAAFEELVPPALRDGLLERLAERAALTRGPDLQAFVLSNIVNLIAISELYGRAARISNSIRLPNVVRAEILLRRAEEKERIPACVLDRIARGILFHALVDLDARAAEDLPRVLFEMRSRTKWRELGAAFGALAGSRDADVDDIWSRIKRPRLRRIPATPGNLARRSALSKLASLVGVSGQHPRRQL